MPARPVRASRRVTPGALLPAVGGAVPGVRSGCCSAACAGAAAAAPMMLTAATRPDIRAISGRCPAWNCRNVESRQAGRGRNQERSRTMTGSAPRREQRVNLETMIDRYMEREGLTLEAMARRSGLSLATIAALRSGTRGKRPRRETVAKLAHAMGVDRREVEAAVGGGGRRREEALL